MPPEYINKKVMFYGALSIKSDAYGERKTLSAFLGKAVCLQGLLQYSKFERSPVGKGSMSILFQLHFKGVSRRPYFLKKHSAELMGI
jgi:hypothetical protein